MPPYLLLQSESLLFFGSVQFLYIGRCLAELEMLPK